MDVVTGSETGPGAWSSSVGDSFLKPYGLNADKSTITANGTKGPIHPALAQLEGIQAYTYQGNYDNRTDSNEPRYAVATKAAATSAAAVLASEAAGGAACSRMSEGVSCSCIVRLLITLMAALMLGSHVLLMPFTACKHPAFCALFSAAALVQRRSVQGVMACVSLLLLWACTSCCCSLLVYTAASTALHASMPAHMAVALHVGTRPERDAF